MPWHSVSYDGCRDHRHTFYFLNDRRSAARRGEALISYLYAAYEYCETPNLAAEIHTIWTTLLFNPIEDDNARSMQLKTLSDAMKNGV